MGIVVPITGYGPRTVWLYILRRDVLKLVKRKYLTIGLFFHYNYYFHYHIVSGPVLGCGDLTRNSEFDERVGIETLPSPIGYMAM